MRTFLLLLSLTLFVVVACAQTSTLPNAEALKKKYTDQLKKQSTAVFEENKGQMKDQYWQPRQDVLYYGSSEGMNYFIRNSGMSYQLSRVESWKDSEEVLYKGKPIVYEKKEVVNQIGIYRVDAEWVNHNHNFIVEKGKELGGYNNYYNVPEGIEPALFVKKYEDVTIRNLWSGIDIHYYGANGFLETDYLVAPGADYKQIQIEIKGAELCTDNAGNLIMETPFGKIQEGKLKVYQSNELLKAKWVISPTENGGMVSFEISNYNPNLAMRIDPLTRVWGTYYGGDGDNYANNCTTDDYGSVYLAGWTESTYDIASGGHQSNLGGNTDAYVVKFNGNGVRQWATYYGGDGGERGNSCCTDGSGNVYLAGETTSTTDVAFGGHQSSYGGGGYDAFLVKFNSVGVRQWATYYGGTDYDHGSSCAADEAGNVYLSGSTYSTNGIAFAGHQNSFGGELDAYLVKFNSSGVRQWATYYGEIFSADIGFVCATDGSDNVYLTGFTESTTGIAFGGHQTSFGGGTYDAFLVKFNGNGIRQWATFYGGGGDEISTSCVTDSSDNVYMAGRTGSSSGIAFGGHQNDYGGVGSYDAFLVKFNSSGVRQWATYYGGSGTDEGHSCAIDHSGNVYLSGSTESTNSIATAGPQSSHGGGITDAFIVKFNSAGIRQWATYFGGNARDYGYSCCTDLSGNVYMAGWTQSTTGIASGGHQNYNAAINDVFLVKFKQSKIVGWVWQDLDTNCIKDTSESGVLNSILLSIQPGNYVAQSIGGAYSIDSLPVGVYTVSVDTSNTNWILNCPVSQTFAVTDPNALTQAPSFGFVSRYPCPQPNISVVMPRIRRGFPDQPIYVKACNTGTATDNLNNAYVDVELPDFITVQSVSLNYTSLGNNKYRVSLDTLFIGQCVEFTFSTTITTAAVVNQTLCARAELFPQPSCVFDSFPTPYQTNSPISPCTLPWDGSNLVVRESCAGDSVRFVIYNTGMLADGDMQCFAPIRLYVDMQLVLIDSVRIAGRDSVVIMHPGNAQTIRLEADQHPLHPGNSHPNASIERCGVGSWTPGIINTMPQDDADPVVDIFCGVVMAPYDPNDKTGFPLGVGATHGILRNQEIEYLIRFQNIGTDTAVNVVVRDTLTTDLDIFSVKSGVSSHPYVFSMYGQRVLEWKFNNIMLPDSNTNEPESNGFVIFRVKQNQHLPYGTVILNTASIYFDFEEPVVTNTYSHTISEPQQIVITNITDFYNRNLKVFIAPNPAQNTAMVTVENIQDNTTVDWQLYDFAGRLIQTALKLPGNKFVINCNELNSGMYFYCIAIQGETIGMGKLLVE